MWSVLLGVLWTLGRVWFLLLLDRAFYRFLSGRSSCWWWCRLVVHPCDFCLILMLREGFWHLCPQPWAWLSVLLVLTRFCSTAVALLSVACALRMAVFLVDWALTIMEWNVVLCLWSFLFSEVYSACQQHHPFSCNSFLHDTFFPAPLPVNHLYRCIWNECPADRRWLSRVLSSILP